LTNWVFEDKAFCSGAIKAGKLNNIAPEATTLVNPELTGPKVKTVT